MSDALSYLWRHPRRTGFITLNILVLLAFIAWGAFTADAGDEGIGALPYVMLGYTGMALLLVVWVVAWLAWAWLIARHHLTHRR
jgi:hypothetical protein